MDAATFVREGRPLEALDALQKEVRSHPAEPKHRVFLFQLLAILGQWERAANQLKVAAELDASLLVLANIYRSAIRAEMLRAEVFAGRRTPLILGEPEPWIGDLLESLRVLGGGDASGARDLRDRSLEAAPAVGGAITVGEDAPVPFEWIADCDSRTGPLLEMILEGRYYWVPIARIRSLQIQPPTDLRDLVWLPADAVWVNGGDASALIPVRYPGTVSSADGAALMSRTTAWSEPAPEYLVGEGARVLVTDADEYALLNVRRVQLDHPEEANGEGG